MDFSSSTVSVTSYNAHNINDGTNYQARIPGGTPLVAENDAAFVERLDDYPEDARTHLKERNFPLVINTVAGTADQLKRWFNEGKLTKKKLILTDSSDSSTWYVYAKFKSMVKRRNSVNVYDIILTIADSIWRNNTATTDSWTVTSSGETHNHNVVGTEFARPTITITPRGANSSGYTYKRFVTVYNQTDRAFVNYPLNITGGNFDHAALVPSKAQADGDDFRCFYDGNDREMWTGGGGYNSTTLRPFINIDLSPRIEFTTLGSIASTGAVSVITVSTTTANVAALQKLSKVSNKLILIESELFSFTSVVISAGGLQLTGCARAQKGSSMASHSAGLTARHIEHDIWIYYGLSTATAPTLRTSTEPIITKATSTNTSWVYADFFDSANPGRSGSWRKAIIASSNQASATPSRHYGANQATNYSFSAIASEMGMSMKAWLATIWRAENAELEWRFSIPSGVTTVTAGGEKYRATTSWPALVGLQASMNGATWETIWNEATPSAATTWESVATHSAVSLGATYQLIRFVMKGLIAAVANNLAHIEHDGVTLALDSNTVPVVGLGAEQATYYVNVRVQNDNTGDFIDLRLPGAVDFTVTVDCDAKTVTGQDGSNMRDCLTYGPEQVRQDWLTVDPSLNNGVNVISITETGLSDMDIVLSYEARSV